MKYELGKELKITFSNDNLINSKYFKNKITTINECMKNLEKLNDIIPISLDKTSSILCEVYKLFYNEYPDFSSKNINIKIQTMVVILTEFGIILDDKISFIMLKNKIPISLYLQKKINTLIPLGQIESVNNYVIITEDVSKTIKAIKEVIKEFITNKDDEIKFLQKFSNIIYIRNNIASPHSKTSELAKICNCQEFDISDTIKLVKK